MEEGTLHYSPYFANCQQANETAELFPELNADFDYTLEDYRDKPASIWSVKAIGLLQSKFERSNSWSKRNVSTIPVHSLISACNEVFGFDGWRTEIIDVEMTNFEEIIIDNDALGENGAGSDMEEEILRYDDDGLIVIETGTTRIKYTMEVTTKMRLILKDGTYHDAVGVGRCHYLPLKAMAFTKSKKESITNGIKNCILELKEMLIEYERKRNNGFYV